MDILAHFVFGLWLSSKIGGVWTILLSCIFDIDHVIGYIYDKRKKKKIEIPSSFLHLAYRPRSWFHSATGLLLIAIPAMLFIDPLTVFLPLLFHLLIDVGDKDGIFLLPPFTWKKLRGPIPVGYLVEDPGYLKRHKRSHIPSLVMIILFALLILYGI